MRPNRNTHFFVQNIAGSSEFPPCGCPSWLEHHRRHAEAPHGVHCARVGCSRPAAHGAHVRIDDGRVASPGRTGWIVPFCAACNNPNNTGVMAVEREAELVLATRLPDCGFARLPPNRQTHFRVFAADHAAVPPDCGCRSWLQHWRQNSESTATVCVVAGCSGAVASAMRVMVDDRRMTAAFWTIPVCGACRGRLRREAVFINRRAVMVPVEDLDFCG